MESIIVYDKGIQCDGLFDFSDGRFSVFDPVRILSFLIKELEHLVKDDEASKILTDMEQVLLRLAMEPTKPLTVVCLLIIVGNIMLEILDIKI